MKYLSVYHKDNNLSHWGYDHLGKIIITRAKASMKNLHLPMIAG